jgi:hypothetical protein
MTKTRRTRSRRARGTRRHKGGDGQGVLANTTNSITQGAENLGSNVYSGAENVAAKATGAVDNAVGWFSGLFKKKDQTQMGGRRRHRKGGTGSVKGFDGIFKQYGPAHGGSRRRRRRKH